MDAGRRRIELSDPERSERAERRLAGLLRSASIELSPGDSQGLRLLAAYFDPGTAVHITSLPNERPSRVVEMAAALAREGFVPVPHIAARSLTSRDALDDLIARLAGEAGVTRALLIGGDVDRPQGPFAASLDVLRTGILQDRGIAGVAFAGHPEGHPAVAAEVMRQALLEKVRFAIAEGLSVTIINQLCFEAEPLLRWLADLRKSGIAAPVRLGIAGPTSTTTMLRFALRCGVGNSVRALSRDPQAIGRLLGDTRPDGLLDAFCGSVSEADMGAIEGLHFFVFGGLRKMGDWLREARTRHPSAEGAAR